MASESTEMPRAGFYESVRARALGTPAGTARRDPARWYWPAAGMAAAVVVVLAIAGILRPGAVPPAAGDVPATSAVAASPIQVEPSSLPAGGRDFVAGVHYERLAEPVPTATGADTIEVCEFFLFTCSPCFSLEPMLAAWSERQPDDVRLVRVPAIWNALARLHAQAFYAAEELGVLDALIEPMFSEIHERGNDLTTVDEVRAFFVSQGVTAAEFDRAFESRGVAARIRQAQELNRLYGVDSTPTVTVNGRFVTGPTMAGSYAAIFDVVDALVESERAAPSSAAGSSGRLSQ
jgi:thiol:disulfide interchange protein DsbA